MNLGKIVENEDLRLMREAALAAACLGGLTVLTGLLAENPADRAAGIAIGLLQLGLAFGVSRGSRASAVAVFGLFILSRLIQLVVLGPLALLSFWNLVLLAVLFAGMRATFAAAARKREAQARARPAA
jgi:hypothetical protein